VILALLAFLVVFTAEKRANEYTLLKRTDYAGLIFEIPRRLSDSPVVVTTGLFPASSKMIGLTGSMFYPAG
jgi:hypothetical protein